MTLDERVENVVAEARLGGPFDIIALADNVPGAQYRPDRFIGLIVHIHGGSALVFEDGRVVTTGARGIEAALAQMEEVRELLGQAGAETTGVEGFHVRNVVMSASLGGRISLEQIRLAFPEADLEWDPERFPGMLWRRRDPALTLLLFGSGKVVGTGTGDEAALRAAIEELAEELIERRLVPTASA